MQIFRKWLLPFRHGVPLSDEQRPKTSEEERMMRQIPYASVVGSLMYAMLCTRADICYSVGIVSWYQSNPRPKQWEAIKHILKDYTLKEICYSVGIVSQRSICLFTIVRIWWLLVTQILIFSQILISESPLQVTCSPWEVEPLVEGVLNNLVLVTSPWKLNMLLLVK